MLLGGAMIVVFPLISIYEATRFKGSHNLIPFELIIFAVGAIPLVLAAWLGRKLADRRERADPAGDGTGEEAG